jgi:hypothetical protein
MITGGQEHEAVAYLLEVAERMPDDAETQFMLGLAYTATDQLDNAQISLKKALDLGLPPGRIVAGPRDLLEPLRDSELNQKLVRHNPIVHGPMIGNVTHDAAGFWVRTGQPLIVALYVWRSGGPTKRSDPVLQQIREEDDYTAVVRVTGLQPDTEYLYNLLVHNPERMQMLGWREGTFRTPPESGEPTKFKLAFGGGAGFGDGASNFAGLAVSNVGFMNVRLAVAGGPQRPGQQALCGIFVAGNFIVFGFDGGGDGWVIVRRIGLRQSGIDVREIIDVEKFGSIFGWAKVGQFAATSHKDYLVAIVGDVGGQGFH